MSDGEQLGKLAKDILENEAFNKAFDAVKEEITREWFKAAEPEKRDEAWRMVRLLEKVKWQLEYFMDDGNKAEIDRKNQDRIDEDAAAEAKRKKEYLTKPLPGTRTAEQYAELATKK